MSTSKWAYNPKRCDGRRCPGDCDRCTRWQEDEGTDTDIISKAEVLAAIRERYKEICTRDEGFEEEQVGFLAGLEDAEDVVESIPAEEARPKVYCKDCAKRHNGCPLQIWCGPQDDDFCSRGVPKE